jgi:carboxymethylenebutenolidase
MSLSYQINTTDGTFGGYLALPKNASTNNPAPGIVVLQEIFGVNGFMRDTCDWLAENGYCALCPDLFWRIEPGIDLTDQNGADLKRAFELFGIFDVDRGMTDAAKSIAALRAHPVCNGVVGTLGYCLGGKLAFLSATRTDSDASVSYYGVSIDELLDEAGAIKKPLLMHMAKEDEFVPPSAQKAIVSALEGNPLVEIEQYAGRSHAFARAGGAHYHAGDAKRANARTLSFFMTNL